jgi:3-hydroxymyristoyl/3-hydroxydecanoyl-(acyl carrier protein) dehydratase
MNEIVASQFTISPDHPALAGHFPGRPVVPGVLLLESALAAVPSAGNWMLLAIPAAKFLNPVLPGQVVRLHIELLVEEAPRIRARFHGTCGAEVAFEGSFLFSTGGTAA